MTNDDEVFEAYLAGFSAVDVPPGARERILAPALAVADGLGPARQPSFGEWLAASCGAFFATPLRLLAVTLVLVAANGAVDDMTPVLVDELAAGRRPAAVSSQVARSADGRGWFIDAKTFELNHGRTDSRPPIGRPKGGVR